MKKYLIFFLCLIFFAIPLSAFAITSSMSSYYPSPSGNYTKVQLVNSAGGPDENSTTTPFCLETPTSYDPTPTTGHTYINSGTIFSDPTTGYLENCRADGTVVTYPGGSFDRYCMTDGCESCPANYGIVHDRYYTFDMPNYNANPHLDKGVIVYTCSFTNILTQPTQSQQQSTQYPFAKSGCFSNYSDNVYIPAACSTSDPNAHDMGCTGIVPALTINGTGLYVNTFYKRNCCFLSGTQPLSNTSTTCPLDVQVYSKGPISIFASDINGDLGQLLFRAAESGPAANINDMNPQGLSNMVLPTYGNITGDFMLPIPITGTVSYVLALITGNGGDSAFSLFTSVGGSNTCFTQVQATPVNNPPVYPYPYLFSPNYFFLPASGNPYTDSQNNNYNFTNASVYTNNTLQIQPTAGTACDVSTAATLNSTNGASCPLYIDNNIYPQGGTRGVMPCAIDFGTAQAANSNPSPQGVEMILLKIRWPARIYDS